jgi:hypothetical protein
VRSDDVIGVIEAELQSATETARAAIEPRRRSFGPPRRISAIRRTVQDGEVHDALATVWLIFEEVPGAREGYRIVFDEEAGIFGLATVGFPKDEHLVLLGWYGSFVAAFKSM